MPRPARTYRLTSELVAAHAGAPVVCLDRSAEGRTYRLHARRPGPEQNRRLGAEDYRWSEGGAVVVSDAAPPALVRVDVRGVLEQRAGYHDVCAGWSDGHDAIAERLCAAMAEGDVLLVVDSPGGACAGLQEAIRAVLKAKAELGRRVTAWADEMIGSAAAWWVLSVADEVFIPQAGIIGSIGARSAHCSYAEALKKEGVEITHFTWPDEGKVALAPDRPLSDEGRARGERDVRIAGEAFAAAVAAGPVGQRYGLTRDRIAALKADALTGQRAVDAGLADGVASLDEVTEYALALASGEEATMASEYEKTTKERFVENDPEPEKDEAAEDEEMEGDEKPAESEDETPEEEAEDEEAPPSSKAPAKDSKAEPPAAMKATASLSEILGARGESAPALKAAAIGLRQLKDFGAKLTGHSSVAAIIGGLSAMADDLTKLGAKLDEVRGKHAKLSRRVAYRERMDLLHTLEKIGAYTRGELFVDAVTDDGKRIVGTNGQAKVKPAPMWAEMKLGTLRGLVAGKVANAGSKPVRRSPFDPDRKAAETAAKTGGIDLKILEQHPTVKNGASRPGAPSIDKLAASFAATFPDEAAQFCRQNGAR